MTRIEFDRWVEKKYPELLTIAKKMEKEQADAEDLLQETVLFILEHESYQTIDLERTNNLNPLYAFTTYMNNIKLNKHKQENRRMKYDALAVPLEETTDPYPMLDTQIFIDELYEQVGPYTRMFLYGILKGYTMKEVYYMSNVEVSYSYFLRQVKADLEKVLI